jgi:hypothetical protein
MSDVSLLNIKALYQKQAEVSYFLTGFSVARLFGDQEQHMVGAGLWYRSGESFAPQVFVEYNRMQFGFTYDMSYNGLKKQLTPASSFELSFQWRVGE